MILREYNKKKREYRQCRKIRKMTHDTDKKINKGINRSHKRNNQMYWSKNTQ